MNVHARAHATTRTCRAIKFHREKRNLVATHRVVHSSRGLAQFTIRVRKPSLCLKRAARFDVW
jgi:hypothetical protein